MPGYRDVNLCYLHVELFVFSHSAISFVVNCKCVNKLDICLAFES